MPRSLKLGKNCYNQKYPLQSDSIVDKLTGTLTRKKKAGHENAEDEKFKTEEDEALEVTTNQRSEVAMGVVENVIALPMSFV